MRKPRHRWQAPEGEPVVGVDTAHEMCPRCKAIRTGPLPPAHRTDPPWWVVLGVAEDAPLEAVRAAYRALARESQINRAYENAQRKAAGAT